MFRNTSSREGSNDLNSKIGQPPLDITKNIDALISGDVLEMVISISCNLSLLFLVATFATPGIARIFEETSFNGPWNESRSFDDPDSLLERSVIVSTAAIFPLLIITTRSAIACISERICELIITE